MRFRCTCWITAILLAFTSPVIAQLTIQGWVSDEKSGEGLPGASVFLASTTFGTVTDVNGNFTLTGLKPGHFKMVISFISYDIKVIEVDAAKPSFYNVKLRPSAKQLNAVVISAGRSRLEWLSNFRVFKDNFVGTSDNAKNCFIRNRDVLRFVRKNGVLKAFADSVLIIDNLGLGYRMKFTLGKYEYNLTSKKLYYDGQLLYETLEPADDRQQTIWEQRRMKAYHGSMMHFYRALYHHRLTEEGFFFNLITTKLNKKGKLRRTGIADTTVRVETGPLRRSVLPTISQYHRILDSTMMIVDEAVLDYNGELEVTYINEVPSFDFQAARVGSVGNVVPQTSTLRLLKPCPRIEPFGRLYPQDSAETTGYWNWELLAESLPDDYELPDDNP